MAAPFSHYQIVAKAGTKTVQTAASAVTNGSSGATICLYTTGTQSPGTQSGLC